jgi:hypothetical protein
MRGKRRILCIAIVLLMLIAMEMVFALESQPYLTWSGETVTAKNPNPKRASKEGVMTDVQICIGYIDGAGQRQDTTTPKFDLAPGESRSFNVLGTVTYASPVSCIVIKP